MLRFRTGSYASACAALLAACTRSQAPQSTHVRTPAPRPALVGTFSGSFDPATGKLSIQTAPATEADAGALTVLQPDQDGSPGTGSPNTFEMVTEASPAPGFNDAGCGGSLRVFEGSITLRSFFKNQALKNVYAQITWVSGSQFTPCGVDAAPPGLASTYGGWSYGRLERAGLAPTNAATKVWSFRNQAAGAFWFQGRILADVDTAVQVSGTPEFDWYPTDVAAPRSFQPTVQNTLAHLEWNGTAFDTVFGSTVITFVPAATGMTTTALGWFPDQPYVSGFTGSRYFVADAAHGGTALDLSRDFTACVKFKPGPHPGFGNPSTILLGKGAAEPATEGGVSDGWALMQMHLSYCFHWATEADNGEMTTVSKADETVETFPYDYFCGGRSGTSIFAGTAGGRQTSFSSVPDFSAGNNLPLVIGAYPGGLHPSTEAGVYEVIFDRRAATPAVMNEIILAAEGGQTLGNAAYVPSSGPVDVLAPDGATTITFAPFTTIPVATDGKGLLQTGRSVSYLHPLSSNTTATGFCIGAEVVATGDWASVSYGALRWGDGATDFDLRFGTPEPNRVTFVAGFGGIGFDYTPLNLANGTGHTFKVCVPPAGNLTLHIDGNQVGTATVTGPIPNLNSNNTLEIGRNDMRSLAGARIRRVFACPSSNPATCN